MRPDVSAFISDDSENVARMQVIPGEIGFDLPNSNLTSTLLTAAEAYSALGWSVIPLHGDRDTSRPKAPVLPWSGYQTYPASLEEQRRWFTEAGFAGLGIVTGRISKLVVLDFDTEEAYKSFCRQYSDLTETRIIHSASRQLPHLYFRLPDHLNIESGKGQGVDLLSNGRYVVAPPTTINGQSYTIARSGMPRILTERDIRRLQAFLTAYRTRTPLFTVNTKKPPFRGNPETNTSAPKPSSHDLKNVYQYYCQRGGRNEALFRTSLYARDTGWQETAAQQCLVELHSQQAPQDAHPPEKPEHRHKEAQKTIRSAFSRPARRTKPKAFLFNNQLPNSLREALMQLGMTYVVRTYEGLIQSGVHAGQIITAKQAVELLKGLVGRDSILNTLKSTHQNRPLFAQSPPVSPRYAVATENPKQKQKNAFLLVCKNQEKVSIGRPHYLFEIPSIEFLCRLFSVKTTSSDPLQKDDLASAQKTRSALHRELIKRRPAAYTYRWLAKRLGVSRRTIHNYNRLVGIHSRAMFTETPISWNSITRLPFDEPIQGAYLETIKGKKYPALRPIAANLIAKGEGISLKQRTANSYWYGQEEPILKPLPIRHALVIHKVHKQVFPPQQSVDYRAHAVLPEKKPTTLYKPKQRTQNFHIPLKNPEQEVQAQAFYFRLNQMTTKQFSLANARRLITHYDTRLLISILDRITRFKTLTNPAGLLITILRSSKISQ